MMELIGKFTGLKVRMATLPHYIRMTDVNGQGMESLQLAAIMYAASKKVDDDDCLQIPAPPEPDIQPKEPEIKPVNDTKSGNGTKVSKGPGLFGRISKKMGEWFTPIGEDDEGDELT